MDDSPNQKPADAVAPEIPGMKEALARMQPNAFKDTSSFFQIARDTLAEQFGAVVFPTIEVMKKTPIVVKEPLALLTAVPYVQNLRLNRALGEIASIPEGKKLVDSVLDGTKVELNCDPRYTGGANCFFTSYTDGNYKQSSNLIRADGYTTHGETVGILIHELHHQRQMQNGVMTVLKDKVPSPVELVWYERAMEADAQATATDIAWKLKEAGKPAAWEAMAGLGGWRQQVTEAYAQKAEQDPASVTSGAAKREAFDAWFTAKSRNGDTVPQIYNRQALGNMPTSENMHDLYKAGKPLEPISAQDIQKLGSIAEVNYLALPGGKPLDSIDYRQADWNGFQGGFLHARHQQYDQIRNGTFKVAGVNPAAASKFANPAKPCEAPKAEVQAAAKPAVSLKRPALKM